MDQSIRLTSKNEQALPFIPLLIGRGKLAKHLTFYFSSRNLPFYSIANARTLDSAELRTLAKKSTAIWILVSDGAITQVAATLYTLSLGLPILHSSAATSVPGALTLHPLQTFGPELYSPEIYETFPWMQIKEEWHAQKEAGDALKKSLKTVFSNPTFEILNQDRARYHAYCVMMANFPQLLWSQTEADAEHFLPSPHQLFAPILRQTLINYEKYGKEAVTGPIVRRDLATLASHVKALAHSPLLSLYQNFVSTFLKSSPENSLFSSTSLLSPSSPSSPSLSSAKELSHDHRS